MAARSHSTVKHSAEYSPRQNRILAALPAADYARLLPDLELVSLSPGEALYEAGDLQQYVYFLTTSTVSKLYTMEAGHAQQVAVVGNSGVMGVALFMGGESAPHRAVVLTAGHAYRLSTPLLQAEFRRGGAMQKLLLRYTHALIAQMSQTVVCNRFHTIDQQLCRWLLLSLDQSPSNELTITQEFLAYMLGVRREEVDAATSHLQADGLIDYSRSKLTMLDRPKLEARVCSCYVAVKREYDRLLPSRAGDSESPGDMLGAE